MILLSDRMIRLWIKYWMLSVLCWPLLGCQDRSWLEKAWYEAEWEGKHEDPK